VIACRVDRRAVVITTIVALFFAVEVGYSRMYRGHHFLTDVIAGACIGVAWVIIAYRFVLSPYIRERREKRVII
jgi:membrane-associated phospholipid phosphatase